MHGRVYNGEKAIEYHNNSLFWAETLNALFQSILYHSVTLCFQSYYTIDRKHKQQFSDSSNPSVQIIPCVKSYDRKHKLPKEAAYLWTYDDGSLQISVMFNDRKHKLLE